MRRVIFVLIAMIGLSACPEEERDPRRAAATIAGKGAAMAMGGTALFEEVGNGVRLTLTLSNAPPGDHGVHVHEGMSCADTVGDAGAVAAGAAGGHFNPTMEMHGEAADDNAHAGDLGNIEVEDDGRGELTITTRYLMIGEGVANLVGKAIVIHADPDDEMTDPSGDSGARIGCGIIQ